MVSELNLNLSDSRSGFLQLMGSLPMVGQGRDEVAYLVQLLDMRVKMPLVKPSVLLQAFSGGSNERDNLSKLFAATEAPSAIISSPCNLPMVSQGRDKEPYLVQLLDISVKMLSVEPFVLLQAISGGSNQRLDIPEFLAATEAAGAVLSSLRSLPLGSQ